MRDLTGQIKVGRKRPTLTKRPAIDAAIELGVLSLKEGLKTSLLCSVLAVITLTGCSGFQFGSAGRSTGLKASLYSSESLSAKPEVVGSAVMPKSSLTAPAVEPVTPRRKAAALNADGFRRTQERDHVEPRTRLRSSVDPDAAYAGGGLVVDLAGHRYESADLTPVSNSSRQVLGTSTRPLYQTLDASPRLDELDDGNPLHQLMALGKKPKVVRASRPLQCVPFARDKSGVEIFGNANRWWDLARGKYRRTRAPEVGAVLVMNGYRTTRRGHVAVVSKIVDDRTIVVDHANWLNDGKIYLNAPVQDVSGEGDWSRVRVWYTPSQQWGRRIYSAKGFILPENKLASIGFR